MKNAYLLLLILFAPRLCFSQSTDALIAKAAASLEPKLVEMRRDFHMNPELSNKEIRTSRIVAERLKALGLEVRTGYGVVGILKGGLSMLRQHAILEALLDRLRNLLHVLVAFADEHVVIHSQLHSQN